MKNEVMQMIVDLWDEYTREELRPEELNVYGFIEFIRSKLATPQ